MKRRFRMISAIVLSLCMICNFSVFAETSANDNSSKEIKQLEKLIVVYDNNDKVVDIDSIDEESYDGYIFRLKDQLSNNKVNSVKKQIKAIDDKDKVDRIYGDYIYSADSLNTIADVVDPEMIEYIEPDFLNHAHVYSTNDTYYSYNEKAYKLVNAPAVWELGMTGKYGNKSSTVAVIDSGIAGWNTTRYPEHEDINYNNIPCVYTAYNFGYDDLGHGTFVTGEIAAIANNGKGVNGFVPDVTVLPLKVLDHNNSVPNSILIASINACMVTDEVDNVDVINMSVGGPYKEQSFQEIINDATSEGMIIVASAGNEAEEGNPVEYPAAYNNVISVAATDIYGQHANYSCYNSYVDVCAPGIFWGPYIRYRDDYIQMKGTSMSAPVVSSLAAMAKSLDPSINTTRFMNILKSTSKDLGSSGRDNYYGYGMVDFKKVYDALATRCNHSYKWVVTKKATTYSDGLREYKCSKCGNVADSVVIPYIETLELSKESFSYTGKTIKPKLIVEDGEGDTISSSYYTTKINKTSKSVGAYTMTVTFKTRYKGTEKLKFSIVPGGTTISKATAGTGSCKLTWKKKTTQVTGYQIQYSLDPEFLDASSKLVKKNKTTSLKISGLDSENVYYFRIRTYKTVSGKKYYSAWSASKKATIK